MRRGTASPSGPPAVAAACPLLAGLASAALAAVALLPATAAAQSLPTPVGPWDGSNPFNCLNQDVGQGTDFPEPKADPFCVEFDKTSQNVTDFGIADFLSKEPARVAAAGTKCFYYQRDHWTGSIVQGSDPEIWHWDGSYFFDRAKGIGGAHLTNFRIGGSPADATPYVPPQYQPYVEPTGGGGAIVLLETDPDPSCGALVDTPEERADVYTDEPHYKRCAEPGGQIRRRRVGRVRIGMTPREVRKQLGPPRNHKNFTQRWCLTGGSTLSVYFHNRNRDDPGAGAPRGAALIRSDNPGFELEGIGVGSRVRHAISRLGLERRFRVGHTDVYTGPAERRRLLVVGIRGERVRWLALADPNRVPGEQRLQHAVRAAR
jgi:hypothetical protein